MNNTILDLESNLELSNQWKSERWQEEENQDENEIRLDNNNELTTADRDNLLKNNSDNTASTNNTQDEYIKCDLFDRRSIYENDDDDFGDEINNTSNEKLSHNKIVQNGISVMVRENGDEQIVQVEIIETSNGIYSNDDDDEIDDELIDADDQLNSFDDADDGNEFNENSELLAVSENGEKKMMIAIEDENINSVKGVTEDCGEIIVINVKNENIMNKDYERNDDDDDDSGGVFTNQDDEDKLLCGDGNNNKNIIGWYLLA